MHAYNINTQNFQLKKTYLNTIFKFYEKFQMFQTVDRDRVSYFLHKPKENCCC